MDWQKLVYWQNGKDILSCRHVFMVKEERAVVMVMPDLHLHTSPSYVFDFCVTINVNSTVMFLVYLISFCPRHIVFFCCFISSFLVIFYSSCRQCFECWKSSVFAFAAPHIFCVGYCVLLIYIKIGICLTILGSNLILFHSAYICKQNIITKPNRTSPCSFMSLLILFFW